MILTDKDIRSLLKAKLSLIREEFRRINSSGVSENSYYFEDSIEIWGAILDQDKDISDEDISLVSGLGMFAARELNDSDEPLRTLLGEFGSLATRLAQH